MKQSQIVPLLALTLAACVPDNDAGSVFTSAGFDATGGLDGDGDGDGDAHSEGAGDGDGDSSGDGDSGDGDSGGIKLDTLPPDSDSEGTGNEGCSFVDLLFVIDNSGSMGGYQSALGIAFPQFAETLVDVLPSGVNVHVGVTSTELGYSGSGNTSISNGVCTFTGDGGQPSDNFYITPDVQNTGKNGAQGRLFDPGGGQHYYGFNTSNAGEVAGLASWFASAAAIGTGGSNIEMVTAPAGWAVDPANNATNAGFLRDEGAVLVVFFMSDEPDQTPSIIDGIAGGQAMLDKVAAAKAGCGGLECVIGGGFLLESACSAQGNLPLDDFLQGMVEPPQVAPLPNKNLAPAALAAEMNALLADTLADVIAAKCDQIPPIG